MEKGFLYYLVDGGAMEADQLCKNELAYVFAGRNVSKTPIQQAGIDNRPGIIFGDSELSRFVRYEPDGSQEFLPSVLRDDLYVGHTPGGFPASRDVVREMTIPGTAVKDEHGRLWEIPKARQYFCTDEGTNGYYLNLPTSRKIDRTTRKWVNGDVKAAYAQLWFLVCEYTESLFSSFDQLEDPNCTSLHYEFPDDLLETFAVEALKTNYRVGVDEVSALGMIDFQICQQIANIAIDFDGYKMMLKKKLSILSTIDSASG